MFIDISNVSSLALIFSEEEQKNQADTNATITNKEPFYTLELYDTKGAPISDRTWLGTDFSNIKSIGIEQMTISMRKRNIESCITPTPVNNYIITQRCVTKLTLGRCKSTFSQQSNSCKRICKVLTKLLCNYKTIAPKDYTTAEAYIQHIINTFTSSQGSASSPTHNAARSNIFNYVMQHFGTERVKSLFAKKEKKQIMDILSQVPDSDIKITFGKYTGTRMLSLSPSYMDYIASISVNILSSTREDRFTVLQQDCTRRITDITKHTGASAVLAKPEYKTLRDKAGADLKKLFLAEGFTREDWISSSFSSQSRSLADMLDSIYNEETILPNLDSIAELYRLFLNSYASTSLRTTLIEEMQRKVRAKSDKDRHIIFQNFYKNADEDLKESMRGDYKSSIYWVIKIQNIMLPLVKDFFFRPCER